MPITRKYPIVIAADCWSTTASMKHGEDIQVQCHKLPTQGVDGDLAAAFREAEASYHESGLDWLRLLADTALPENQSARVYVASTSPSEFVALALRIRQGSREAHALSNFYSSLYTPIVHSERSETLLTALFRHLADCERISSLTLSPLDVDMPTFLGTQQALVDAGWKGIHSWPCFTNWTHPVQEGNYDSYYSGLSSKLKNTISRKTRKFRRAGQGEFRLFTDTEDAPMGLEQFQLIYQKSGKRQEPYPGFIPGLVDLAARRGWLRLGIASYDGTPVAAQLWLVHNQTAFIFKLAYDANYRELSPGTVLTAYLMEHVITTDKVTKVDFMTGDDTYKKDWMSMQSVRQGVAAYNVKSLKGLFKYVSHQFKKFLKKILRRSS